MRYLSVCSGIEAATVAWHPLGWTPVAFSEIEKFPSAVLAHHYPNTPNLGDMTQHEQWPIGSGSVDILVGGTPCQSFSVAGLRKGLADPRGNLALTYLAIADRIRPKWIVWENVPGVLSSSGGRDFGAFLGALVELGYGFAYRVLDAQWFGVAQRRRRVFVVAHIGDWRRAAAVLFERESLRGDPAPSREAREGTAVFTPGSIGGYREGCGTLRANGGDLGGGSEGLVAHHVVGALTARGPDGMGAAQVDAHHYIPTWWDGSDCASTLTKEGAGGNQRMPDKDNFGAVLSPVGYRWQNDREGLVEDGTAPACRASTGSSGFHEMNHPVVVQQASSYARDNAAHAAVACVTGDRTHALTTRCAAAEEDGTGRGTPLVPAAVAFHPTQDPINSTEVCHSISSGNGQGCATAAVAIETLQQQGYDSPYASINETDAAATLRALRSEIGEEAFAVWGLGVLDSLQSSQVLRSSMHGAGIRCTAFTRSWPVYCAISREEDRSKGAVQSVREACGDRCASSRRQLPQQLARELGAYLSELSQPGPQAERLMCDLWFASEGIGSLRQALSAETEARRPTQGASQPTPMTMAVRRLTPVECEFLMGYPRGYTAIPWRGKPASECPDGPRYRALGNSMAVPVMRWIGERIAAQEVAQ